MGPTIRGIGRVTSLRELSMSPKIWIACGRVRRDRGEGRAVGTHVLKETLKLPESSLETYEVAVGYQMYHALGLILVGLLAGQWPSRLLAAAGTLFLLGIVLFSGGVYAWLATEMKPFVHVVPLGGVAWIVGWLVLFVAAVWGRREIKKRGIEPP